MQKQNKEITYTKDQVRELVADIFVKLTVELKDPSLVIAGMLAMRLLDKKLKQILIEAGLLKPTSYQC